MTVLRTTVTKRAQTAVPARIRQQHNIQPGDTLAWIDDGETIKVIPLPQDPVRALRGCAKLEVYSISLQDRSEPVADQVPQESLPYRRDQRRGSERSR